jgi:UDP-glucuronate 4-epimerase
MITLVTGAAGFIGYHLSSALLARGEQVIGIDNMNPYYDPQIKRDRITALQRQAGNGFSFLELDFADDAALSRALAPLKIDRIAHLGAQAGVRYSIENPRAYVQSNLVGHVNMLELARERGVEQMVYASSSSVYGGNSSLPFRVEDRADNPISLYAATKRADELMSETYAHLFRLPQTGLRFFTVYGPWGRPDMALWSFTDAILSGKPIKVFNGGDMRRDFTYIDDIIAGVVACLDTPPIDDGVLKAGGSVSPHRLYNIGNNRSEELNRMIELIEEACGRPAIRELAPMQAGDVKDTYADVSAIARDLGYAPTTGIEVGIPRFVEWFRTYRGL